jgi:hypothetical protein
MTSQKRWKQTAIAVSIGLLAGLALAEIMLRILGISYPSFFHPHPYVGWAHWPGVKGYWLYEGKGWVSINSDGLRDIEHSKSKPPDTVRIAVLGDSFAEAFQVDQEEAFWSIMEKELENCASLRGRKVEVINFGQSGIGTAMELLALRHRVWKYSPDIILLAFFTGNDISDNSRALKKSDNLPFPYFVYERGRLVLNDAHVQEAYKKHSRWSDIKWGIYNSFRVLQILDRGVTLLEDWYTPKDQQKGDSTAKGTEWGLDAMIYRDPPNEIWEDAWKVTEGLLVMMRDEVREKKAQFYVVILSPAVEVHPDPQIRRDYERSLGVKDLFYPVHRIEYFCKDKGIPALALAPYLQEYAVLNKVFLHGFGSSLGKGHWNEAGHRLAGKIIAQWLCDRTN